MFVFIESVDQSIDRHGPIQSYGNDPILPTTHSVTGMGMDTA